MNVNFVAKKWQKKNTTFVIYAQTVEINGYEKINMAIICR